MVSNSDKLDFHYRIKYNITMENNEQNYEDFISTVSHELRTPLTSIRGFSQTMLSSWDKLDDASKKKFIKIIEQQSNRLIGLVENMLAVSKIQSEGNNFIYNETDIKPIIEQTVSIVKNQYQDQKFEINFSDNLSKIFVDKNKFQQIMMNLIENSAKYSPEASTTKIKAYSCAERVVIQVSNVGINIEEKDYDKIFTKFARIDNPLTRKVQGSGLGLFITKNLTEKMGGEIVVKSTKINDTEGEITFTIQMPIKTIEEQTRIKCNQ